MATQARRQGSAYLNKGRWWIQYRQRGKRVREPGGFDGAGAVTKTEAEEKLRSRLGEIGSGRWIGPEADRILVGELLDSYVTHLEGKGAKGTAQTESHLIPVREHFGERRAVDVKAEDVREYIKAMRKRTTRTGSKFADATINRGLQALRAAFNLARKEDRLVRVPFVPLLRESNARTGFFERADFEAVVERLPDPENDIARFAYLTGWRRGEILPLTWADVDRDGATITLRDSKNGDGRTVPLDDDLSELLERRWSLRTYKRADGKDAIAAYVFHRSGIRLWDLPAWHRACEAAGVPGRLLHDLRRTAVRDMTRAGVHQAVAMARTGHKTDAIFRRYNITSAEDQLDAARRLREYRATRPKESNVKQLGHTSAIPHDVTIAIDSKKAAV